MWSHGDVGAVRLGFRFLGLTLQNCQSWEVRPRILGDTGAFLIISEGHGIQKKPQGQPNLRVVRALKTFKAIEPLKSLKPSTSEEFETRCRTVRLEMGFEGLKLEIKG